MLRNVTQNYAKLRMIRKHYAWITQELRINYATITQRLHNGSSIFLKWPLRSDYAAITQNCVMITQCYAVLRMLHSVTHRATCWCGGPVGHGQLLPGHCQLCTEGSQGLSWWIMASERATVLQAAGENGPGFEVPDAYQSVIGVIQGPRTRLGLDGIFCVWVPWSAAIAIGILVTAVQSE